MRFYGTDAFRKRLVLFEDDVGLGEPSVLDVNFPNDTGLIRDATNVSNDRVGTSSDVVLVDRSSSGGSWEGGQYIWVDPDVRRRDHNGNLLVEKQSTRLNVYPNPVNGVGWHMASGATAEGGFPAPDGSNTMSLITGGGNTGGRIQSNVELSTTVTQNINYVASIFVRNKDSLRSHFYVTTSDLGVGQARVNIAWNGSVPTTSLVTGLATFPAVHVGDDVWRCSVMFNTGSNSSARLLFYPHSLAPATGAAYCWGAQLEQGSIPTSHILGDPLSQVTRIKDTVSLDPNRFNLGSRTTYSIKATTTSGPGQVLLNASNTSLNYPLRVDRNSNNEVIVTLNHGVDALTSLGNVPEGSNIDVEVSLTETELKASLDGVAATPVSLADAPPPFDTILIGCSDAQEQWTGGIESVRIVPRA